MKIYFSGSYAGMKNMGSLYSQIVAGLSVYGKVLTEFKLEGSSSYSGAELTIEQVYNRDVQWLADSDVVVAECTYPSTGVGYEIAKVEDMGKKVLCLFKQDNGTSLSAMVRGDKKFVVRPYETTDDLAKIFDNFFRKP